MDVVFENTGFNVEYWKEFTEAAFIKECLRDGILKQYSGEERKRALKEVYKLIQDDTLGTPDKAKGL